MTAFYPGVPTHERLRLPAFFCTAAARLSAIRREQKFLAEEESDLVTQLRDVLDARGVDQCIVDSHTTTAYLRLERLRTGRKTTVVLHVEFKWEKD